MVRNYDERAVDAAVLRRLADNARRGPSAGFSQGVYLVVVTAEDTRRAIAELADEAEWVAKGMDPWISRDPAHIVVAVREADYRARYREADKVNADGTEIDWPVPYWWVDAGAGLMTILLGAVDEGLAAGFFGVHRLAGLRSLLGIPDEVHPIGIVTVGHPAPDRRSASLARGWRPIEQVVHWGHWGSPAPA